MRLRSRMMNFVLVPLPEPGAPVHDRHVVKCGEPSSPSRVGSCFIVELSIGDTDDEHAESFSDSQWRRACALPPCARTTEPHDLLRQHHGLSPESRLQPAPDRLKDADRGGLFRFGLVVVPRHDHNLSGVPARRQGAMQLAAVAAAGHFSSMFAGRSLTFAPQPHPASARLAVQAIPVVAWTRRGSL